MPLRDHFRPPLTRPHSWEGLYGGWPALTVRLLHQTIPLDFLAEPRVHLGSHFETDLAEPTEYEVLVYEVKYGRHLVAAVELVSPANKDRPEHRRAFVAKCLALLQQKVCVAIVDLVTTRQFNLYAELLEMIGRTDPGLGAEPPSLYAVTCRGYKSGRRPLLEAWTHPLTLGQPLPTLPLWLSADLAVPLELEKSYEDTCAALRIR